MRRVIVLCALPVMLAGCVDTASTEASGAPAAAEAGVSATYAARARSLGNRHGVAAGDLAEARAAGAELGARPSSAPAQRFATACRNLLRLTGDPAVQAALDGDTARTMARCGGFFS